MALAPLFIITPTLGWTWPSLLPIALAIAATHGFKKLTSSDENSWMRGRLTREMEKFRRVSVPVDDLVERVGESVRVGRVGRVGESESRRESGVRLTLCALFWTSGLGNLHCFYQTNDSLSKIISVRMCGWSSFQFHFRRGGFDGSRILCFNLHSYIFL